MKSIRKTFGGVTALDDVDFDLYPGEVHCLVGENGAGKSTLIKILSGAQRPDRGNIYLFGEEYDYFTPDQAIRKGVATIYQDIELIDSLTVAENIFLGNEIKNKMGRVNFKEENKQARELMDSLEVDISEEAKVEELSPADQQTLQVVKALHLDAKILIMDEPTSSLGIDETEALMNLVKELASHDIGIIYISHYIEEVFEIGDRITVLKDGKKVNTYSVEDVGFETITKSMIGRKREQFFERDKIDIGDKVLEVKNLNLPGVVEDVSFDLHRGEILGFGGIVGAGRSELMNLIFGSYTKESGSIKLNGEVIDHETPTKAIKNGLAMIPEDRSDLGLFTLRPLLENVALVNNEKYKILNHREEKKLSREMIDKLEIVTEGLDQSVNQLSGGNQQKTIVARWLLSEAEVFIFDEPTKGIDIGAKDRIHALIVELAKQGKGILMVSSDMPELISMSDRIAIMREHTLTEIVDADSVEEHDLIEHFLGVNTNGGNGNV